eukprot:CAMPEP_0118945824 /NCGR_PEP_ID=MMETSP1169-20130426/43041_1 /TAXON_ID=36882 /ORGANISM="Pyramimonas obovata, Strain CCMP722" /LENGTH=326 /DNA_ID=CAMNT_0006891629 /DNA_START=266 /DNA_END=1247 /DNA_ORIENTATION=-
MKSVRRIMPTPPQHWVGDGFHVYPVFHDLAFTKELSPWLMFDYAAPKKFSPTSSRRGVGKHPHRGFETVTVAFQGEVEHGDSVGNRDVIGAGDVQWMTAARGIIHEEFHSTEFAKKGGVFEMCQLWLNLPAKHKMDPPRYQPILAKDIPSVPLPGGGHVKVIAGEFAGVRGPAHTFTPVELWDVELEKKGTAYELNVPAGHNVIVFVRRGRALIGSEGAEKEIKPQGVALMHREGSTLRLVPSEDAVKVMVLGGEPIDEPIAARGPFVMNTYEEIQKPTSTTTPAGWVSEEQGCATHVGGDNERRVLRGVCKVIRHAAFQHLALRS